MPIGRLDTMSDEELAALAVKSGEAYGELMKRYEGRLLAYIRRLSGVRTEDAQDILQDSYIKAYYNLNDFDPKLKFSSWIYRITHNETISDWRKRNARPSVILDEESWSKFHGSEDLAREVDQKIDRVRVEEALNRLHVKYRDVIILKYLEERSYEEIADILRKSPNTVGTLINRGKKQLKKILKKYDRPQPASA
jgi:RNA polymerase sigma-70 factor (ECF subfamily)